MTGVMPLTTCFLLEVCPCFSGNSSSKTQVECHLLQGPKTVPLLVSFLLPSHQSWSPAVQTKATVHQLPSFSSYRCPLIYLSSFLFRRTILTRTVEYGWESKSYFCVCFIRNSHPQASPPLALLTPRPFMVLQDGKSPCLSPTSSSLISFI